MSKNWEEFRRRCGELADLQATLSLLSWDQETMMPARAAAFRARQIASLSGLHHRKLVDTSWEPLLEKLQGERLEPWQEASLREFRRQYDKAARVPESLVTELAETTTLAYEAWLQAKETSQFNSFMPWLKRVLDLKLELARCRDPQLDPYDNLLDDYEPGIRSSDLAPLFAGLQPVLSRLVSRLQQASRQPRPDILQGHFPLIQQQQLAREVLTAMGFQWEAGRLDTSPHPFCTGLTPGDVRITTRYLEGDCLNAFFSVVHEGGHALYEQGLEASWYGLPVCEAVSLGIHESQSRFWENQVARSRPFWEYWFPRLRKLFPSFSQVDLEDFLLAVNQVRPSLIRVDADEVTYGLHVILRFELEQDLLRGKLAVADLEEAWNQKTRDYLGLTPSSASEGVLQDVHWSQGLIGYFPTYLLGNLYAGHFARRLRQDLPVEELLRKGELTPLRDWLREHIHRHGRLWSAPELLHRVTGERLDSKPFLDYLTQKYSDLYNLPLP